MACAEVLSRALQQNTLDLVLLAWAAYCLVLADSNEPGAAPDSTLPMQAAFNPSFRQTTRRPLSPTQAYAADP